MSLSLCLNTFHRKIIDSKGRTEKVPFLLKKKINYRWFGLRNTRGPSSTEVFLLINSRKNSLHRSFESLRHPVWGKKVPTNRQMLSTGIWTSNWWLEPIRDDLGLALTPTSHKYYATSYNVGSIWELFLSLCVVCLAWSCNLHLAESNVALFLDFVCPGTLGKEIWSE